MSIRRVEIERFSLTSSRPFEAVVAALKAGVGRLDLAEFARASKGPGTFADLKKVIERDLGRAGLMLFIELDQNPLIMKEMAKHIPDAGSYAPVTILIDERSDGVHLSYDKMASFLAPYENKEALKVAQDLDLKVENLLNQAAASS